MESSSGGQGGQAAADEHGHARKMRKENAREGIFLRCLQSSESRDPERGDDQTPICAVLDFRIFVFSFHFLGALRIQKNKKQK